MKRIICLFFCSVLMSTLVFSQKNYSVEQRSLRDKVFSYLKSEGFQPSIDSDGDIRFKRQGDVYFVIVSDRDSSPMFLTFTKMYNYGTIYTKAKVASYIQEVNKYKMCKLSLSDNNFSIDVEMFLENASAFTSIFNRVMRAMDAAEEELLQ